MREPPNRPRGRGRRPAPTSAPVSVTRPAARRGGGTGPGTTTHTSAPRQGRFGVRAVVLVVILVALGMSYIIPVRVYLQQRADIAALREEQAAQREHLAELSAEAERWTYNEYIRTQARKRLYYGEPDEQLIIPVWGDDPEPPETGFAPDEAPPPEEPWWDRLWDSVQEADE